MNTRSGIRTSLCHRREITSSIVAIFLHVYIKVDTYRYILHACVRKSVGVEESTAFMVEAPKTIKDEIQMGLNEGDRKR